MLQHPRQQSIHVNHLAATSPEPPIDPLQKLFTDHAEQIAQIAKPVLTRPGEIVSPFGLPFIAVVVRGWFKLVRFDKAGNQQFVALRRHGRTIGLEAGVGARVEPSEVVSLIEGELLTLPMEGVAELLAADARLSRRLAALLAEQADEDFQFRSQAQTSALMPRLVNLLYALAVEEGQPHLAGFQVGMPFSQRELADLLEVRRETISVKICQLESAGLIERWGRELVVNAKRVHSYLHASDLEAHLADLLETRACESGLEELTPPRSSAQKPSLQASRAGWLLERLPRSQVLADVPA